MAGEKVTSAVARREQTGSPRTLVADYMDDFARVLPQHLSPATFVRVAQGALKRGRIYDGDRSGRTELEVAAQNNPRVFMATLLDAARLGLEPGTEHYYLTPRKNKSGQLEILGIVGYLGYIELMFRAGAVSTVVAEVVREHDEFVWTEGALDTARPARWEGPQVRPYHPVRWLATEAERGELVLTYAYAMMKDTGQPSTVIVLNRDDIDRVKRSSQGSEGRHSPWQQHTAAMWKKSAVRQLQKWVPTSAEYRIEQERARQYVIAERERAGLPQLADQPERPVLDTGHLAHVPDGELDGAPTSEAPADLPSAEVPAEADQPVDAELVDEDAPTGVEGRISPAMSRALHTYLGDVGVRDRTEKLTYLGMMVGHSLSSSNELTTEEASDVLRTLAQLGNMENPAEAFKAHLATVTGGPV